MKEERLVVTPVSTPTFSLDALVAEVTPDNLQPESDWGTPEGAEAW